MISPLHHSKDKCYIQIFPSSYLIHRETLKECSLSKHLLTCMSFKYVHNKAKGRIYKQVFWKIWCTLFSWNTRFEICCFVLLPTNTNMSITGFTIKVLFSTKGNFHQKEHSLEYFSLKYHVTAANCRCYP